MWQLEEQVSVHEDAPGDKADGPAVNPEPGLSGSSGSSGTLMWFPHCCCLALPVFTLHGWDCVWGRERAALRLVSSAPFLFLAPFSLLHSWLFHFLPCVCVCGETPPSLLTPLLSLHATVPFLAQDPSPHAASQNLAKLKALPHLSPFPSFFPCFLPCLSLFSPQALTPIKTAQRPTACWKLPFVKMPIN